MVTAAILSLSEAVRELRAARQELARRAVEEERLRFSRDLHDLLGHTLSVIVVKSEAARRLAPRDLDAALAQVTDIEAVGRQALTEIREAVTGYREGSLATELDRARSALTAAGIEPRCDRSGPPLAPQTEALLGWVVREAVTNVVRHSGATRCEITVSRRPDRVRLTVTDDGAASARTRTSRPLRTRRHRTDRSARRLAVAGGRDGGPGTARRLPGHGGAAGGQPEVDADTRADEAARTDEDGRTDEDADGDIRVDADAGAGAARTVAGEGTRGGEGATGGEGDAVPP